MIRRIVQHRFLLRKLCKHDISICILATVALPPLKEYEHRNSQAALYDTYCVSDSANQSLGSFARQNKAFPRPHWRGLFWFGQTDWSSSKRHVLQVSMVCIPTSLSIWRSACSRPLQIKFPLSILIFGGLGTRSLTTQTWGFSKANHRFISRSNIIRDNRILGIIWAPDLSYRQKMRWIALLVWGRPP